MWEYKKKDEKFQTNDDLVKFLNKHGDDNWEVVSYQEEKPENYGRHFNTKILFKRPKTHADS